MASHRLLQLRYPGICSWCNRDLPAGTKAWRIPDTHVLTCVACEIENPADPFAGVDPELRGTAGGSAQAEHDRRTKKAHHNPRSTLSWRKGSQGERHLSAILQKEAGGGQFIVLDDRRIPGSRRNIDHIAVARSGVYAIDAKNYSGKVQRRVEGFWRWRMEHLIVGRRDQTKLVAGVKQQVEDVRAALRELHETAGVPVVPVLCFVNPSNWGLLAPAFAVDGVRVLWPRALKRLLRRGGPLSGNQRTQIARLLSAELPPAV